jgi:hypothetical protein
VRQKEIESIPGLLNLGNVAKGAAAQYGAAIGLVHNNELNLGLRVSALTLAKDQHEQTKVDLATKRAAQRLTLQTCRTFLQVGRDLFKPTLGNEYSEAWDITGFVGSLRMPRTGEEVQPVLHGFKTFLTANPAMENVSANITAKRAGELHDELLAARWAHNVQGTTVAEAKLVRDEKAKELRRSLRGLVDELNQFIEPLDPRWLAFGFNMPGASETPDVPENLHVTLIGNTAAALKWDAAPRAEYYRVWKRVVGVDEELVAVGSPADVDFTIEALPSNAEIEIAVSAVNNGGESAVGEPQRVRTK